MDVHVLCDRVEAQQIIVVLHVVPECILDRQEHSKTALYSPERLEFSKSAEDDKQQEKTYCEFVTGFVAVALCRAVRPKFEVRGFVI